MNPKKRVFISYSSKDRAVVSQLASDLSATGKYDVWYDQRLVGAQAWWDEILEQIRLADVIILALSDVMLKSKPCELERNYASALGKVMVPVQIGKLNMKNLPERLKLTQVIPNQLNRIMGALDVAQSGGLPQPLPPTPSAPINTPSGTIPPLAMLFGGLLVIVMGILVIALVLPSLGGGNGSKETPTLTSAPTDTTVQNQAVVPTTELAPAMGVTPATQVSLAPTTEVIAPLITPVATSAEATCQFEFEIRYADQDSLNLIVKADSDLRGVALEGSYAEAPAQTWEAFAQPSNGVCLRYVREGTSPVTPRTCTTPFETVLTDSDVFWYDDIGNRLLDIVVSCNGERVMVCSSALGTCSVKKP